MQFPELARARIIFGGHKFESDNFKISNYNFITQIEINKKKLDIEIYYLEDKPFLLEEKKLIKELGTRLKVILEKIESEQEKLIAQKELGQSYEKLRELEKIINSSPGVLFLWKNSEGWPVEFVSENITQFGYTQEDFYSGKVIYSQIVHPDDLERVAKEVNRYSDERANEFTQEYRILTKSGKIKWLDDRTWVRKDSEGKITHFQGIVLDITDRKKVQEALKFSERNYKDAYDMANFYKDLFTHDMNNILQIINSSAEIITFQLGDSEKSIFIENLINMIKSQIDRGAKLISDVRTLTSLDEDDIMMDTLDISRYLNESIKFVKKAYPNKKLSINKKEDSSENYLIIGNELLQDVFDNILINAIKYNENTIIDLDIRFSKNTIDHKKYIKIEFIDNGIGVTDARKELIFQPGHRDIKGSKGMGIGLSLVSKIMEIFQGKIWVEDKVKGDYSQGSKFIVLLPEVI
jgi:PAS domain S-box-containing protein